MPIKKGHSIHKTYILHLKFWAHKVISTFTEAILWFYCHSDPKCLCFSPITPVKIYWPNYLLFFFFLTNTKVVCSFNCRNLNSHLWIYKKGSVQSHFESPYWPLPRHLLLSNMLINRFKLWRHCSTTAKIN